MEEKENLIWWKWAKRIVASIGLLVALLIGVSALVANLYEEEIKRYALEQINRKLDTPVEVKEIDLTLIDQFPMASLRFSNVFIADKLSESKKDTMLSVEYLYLNLNFMDLIGGRYEIKKIKASNTVAKLKINKKGVNNYSIFKTDTSAKKSQFTFDLEKVFFDGIDFRFDNKILNQVIDLASEEIYFKGAFSNVKYDLKANGELFARKFMTDSVTYVENKNATLDLDLVIDSRKHSYTINKGDLTIEDLSFGIKGDYVSEEDKNPTIDLNIRGKNIDFLSIFSVFPPRFLTTLKNYKTKGILTFNANLNGEIKKNDIPKITATFNLEQGALTEKEKNISLTNLSFDGEFSNKNKGVNSMLILKNISGKLSDEGGVFSGNLKLKDFSNLQIEADLKADLNLAVIKDFVNNEEVVELDGMAKVNYSISGGFKGNSFAVKKSKGTVNLTNATFLSNANNLRFSNTSGLGILSQNDFRLENFSTTIVNSELVLNASFKNVVSSIFNKTQIVWAAVNIKSKEVDLSGILSKLKEGAENKNENDTLFFPKRMVVKVNATVSKLKYNNFIANNMLGTFTLKNKVLSTQSVKFKTSDGNVLFNAKLEQLADYSFRSNGNAKLEGVDIQKFFASVDNFGQTELTDQNIKGTGNLLLDFGMNFTQNLTLIRPSLTITARTKIKKGVLTNYATLISLATYFDDNKLINKVIDTKKIIKKVDKIKFSELNSLIEIKDNTIHIPKTVIKTNLMDVNISGQHKFNNDIDYHLSFNLRDILLKNKKADDFGPIEDDGMGKKLFIRLFGNLSNPQYELDKQERRANRKQVIDEEKQNVKSIFKDEFGLFKNDSTLKPVEDNQPEPTFEIENWEEGDDISNDKEGVENTIKEEEIKPKKTPKWLKKLGVKEEKEPVNNISIEFEED